MKKVAVIIKHQFRDFDFRVDVYEVMEETSGKDLNDYIMSQMLGPFEIVAITERLNLTCKMPVLNGS
jgi:hypothetical protein